MREVRINLDDLIPLIEEKIKGGEVLFSPNGVSMLPTFKQGRDRLILTSPPKRLKKYDVALFKRENGQYVLHRVVKARGDYTFIGDAQLEYEKNIKPEQIIALCSAYIRDGKRIALDSFGARSYARLIHYTRFLRRLSKKAKSVLRRIFKK